jgi:hypothetical protein
LAIWAHFFTQISLKIERIFYQNIAQNSSRFLQFFAFKISNFDLLAVGQKYLFIKAPFGAIFGAGNAILKR